MELMFFFFITGWMLNIEHDRTRLCAKWSDSGHTCLFRKETFKEMFKSANPNNAAPAAVHVSLRTVSSCGGVNVTIPPSLRTIQPFLDDALKFLRLRLNLFLFKFDRWPRYILKIKFYIYLNFIELAITDWQEKQDPSKLQCGARELHCCALITHLS